MIKKILKKIRQLLTPPIRWAKREGVVVGSNCRFIGHPSWGSEPWLIEIGNHVEISGGVMFLTHDGSTWVFRDKEKYKGVVRFGRIVIGDNCFIGARSTIMPNVTIGPNSIVGACSLVKKDIPPGSVFAGVPAKYICTVEEFAEKCMRESPPYDPVEMRLNPKDTIKKITNR